MNPLLRSNTSNRRAMYNLAHVNPDKFQKIDNVIPNHDQANYLKSKTYFKKNVTFFSKIPNKRWYYKYSQQ